MNLSIALRRSGKLAENALMANSRDTITRSILADLLAKNGDTSRAVSEISQALQPVPIDASTLFQAIYTYDALGSREESLRLPGGGSQTLLLQIRNWSDLAHLSEDPRFLPLLVSRSGRNEGK